MSIRVNHLTKIFGKQKALDNVSFFAGRGEIVGFLGPNGAGKSTTMKIATGYLPPTAGSVTVCGADVEEAPLAVKAKIGYLPEHNPLYHEMYVHESLRFAGKVYGLRGAALKDRVAEMVQVCGLTKEQNKKTGMLSKGYRQRVGLAQALIHRPEVLVLDEPTSGLDPNQILEIRELIKNFSNDKTVIFSSHIMQEVEALCDRVVVIDKGRIVADGALDELRSKKTEVVTVTVEFDQFVNGDLIRSIEGVIALTHLAGGKYRIKATTAGDIRPRLFDLAASAGYKLIGIQQEEVTMEIIFKELTATAP